MNNCHLWILKIYQVDIRNIHYPWYIDGIRKIYAKIYAIVYYVFCTVTVPPYLLKTANRNLTHIHNNARYFIDTLSSFVQLKGIILEFPQLLIG